MAWLAARRVLAGSALDATLKERMEGLRLRALVALTLWQGLSPLALSRWTVDDTDALVWDASSSFWNKWQNLVVWMPARVADGPKTAVRDWMRAAGIHSGPVFRRLNSRGEVSARPLNEVGIQALLGGLLAEGVSMGFITENPAAGPGGTVNSIPFPGNGCAAP